MTVFISSRISILHDGRMALAGVTIPAVLGGGVTPTLDKQSSTISLSHIHNSAHLPVPAVEKSVESASHAVKLNRWPPPLPAWSPW